MLKNYSDVKFDINEENTLIFPNLHDFKITGIMIEGKDIIVTLELNSNKFMLILNNVQRLLSNEFREGNIVLDINIYNNGVYEPDSLKELLGCDNLDEKFATSIIEKIKSNGLNQIVINPSYGCELIAIYETLRICKSI